MFVPKTTKVTPASWYEERIAEAKADVAKSEAKMAALDVTDKLYGARHDYIAMELAGLNMHIRGWQSKLV